MSSTAYERVYGVVKRIPQGRLATYGQVAALAGLGGHARLVGYALSALHDDCSVPWHRVINSRGEVSPRSNPYFEELQRALLEREGLRTDERGRFSLRRYRWRPEGGSSRSEGDSWRAEGGP
jgi:methylated-DNA-protein-cysteine methyltransferase-like protein